MTTLTLTQLAVIDAICSQHLPADHAVMQAIQHELEQARAKQPPTEGEDHE